MEETAVNLAHRFANAAEEYHDRSQWVEAADMHFRAADQFFLAMNDAQNQEVIRTLKLMNANHIRQGKDLQRRVAKAAAATAAAEAATSAAASSPQPKQSGTTRTKGDGGHGSAVAAASTATEGLVILEGATTSGTTSRHRRGSSGNQKGNSGGLGQGHFSNPYRPTLGDLDSNTRAAGEATSVESYMGTLSDVSSDSSSAMIEESFTLIKNHVRDDSDPFNKFWDAVENLVLKISNPVAFTSIPLDGDDPMLLNSPSTEEPPPLSHDDASFADQGAGRELVSSTSNDVRAPQAILNQSHSRLSRSHGLDPSYMQESFFIIDSPSVSNPQKGYSRKRAESASVSSSSSSVSSRPSSASLKRSETTPRTSYKTLEEYAMENQQLKMSMDKLSKRNMKLEKNLEGVMQMSVWTKDVQRSAMQLIKSQDILRPVKQSVHDLSAGTEKGVVLHQRPQQMSSSSLLTTLSASQTNSNPATMQARLLELEEEVLRLKLENSKINSLMKKYKQRWEDLKESAKKRRGASSTPPDGIGEVSDSGGNLSSSDYRSSSHRPLMQGSGVSSPSNINPYASSTLVGNPNGSSTQIRSLSNLSRSSSASGPVLSAGGSYQRRILMENKAGGMDPTPLNTHRHLSSGVVSSTPPRVLDASPRTATNVSSPLITVPEVERPASTSPAPTCVVAPPATSEALQVELGGSAASSPKPLMSPTVLASSSKVLSPQMNGSTSSLSASDSRTPPLKSPQVN